MHRMGQESSSPNRQSGPRILMIPRQPGEEGGRWGGRQGVREGGRGGGEGREGGNEVA